MKKNIIIISGFYPTNGILSLISYFSYSLIFNKDFKKKYDLKILIFYENNFLKIKKFIFNIYSNLKNIFLNQKNRIHGYAYNAKQFIQDHPNLRKNIVLYSNEKDFIDLNPQLIFPIYFPIKKYKINSIGYIYDFQHKDLPELFTRHEINLRNKLFLNILRTNNCVLVNSDFVKGKLKKYFNSSNNKVIKIPFLPYIQNDSNKKKFKNLKKKYGIKKDFFIICNHFWKHKNHNVAFEAFNQFLKFNPNYQLICTGDLIDTRHPEYFKGLSRKYQKIFDKKKILILGVISKDDQICLLKNANAVIQPTSYEGGPGGFSAYEAIAYKKNLLISDILVNKEIKDKNVFFFKNNSSKNLLKKLIFINNKKTKKVNKKIIFNNSKINKEKLGFFLFNLVNKMSKNIKY